MSTPCCPAIPTVVHLTIGSGLGVVPLTFDAPSDAWLGSNSVHGHTVNWSWQCVDAGGGNFTFTLTAHWPDGCSLTDARFVCDICNCSPLHFHYLLTGGVPCGFAVGEVDDLDVTL